MDGLMLVIVCLKEIYISVHLKKQFIIVQYMVHIHIFYHIKKGLGYEVSYPKYRWHKKKSKLWFINNK